MTRHAIAQRSVSVFHTTDEADNAFSERLCETLKEAGFEPWRFGGDILVGDSVVAEVAARLDQRGPVVLCLSARALGTALPSHVAEVLTYDRWKGQRSRLFPVQNEQEAYVAPFEKTHLVKSVDCCGLRFATGVEELVRALGRYLDDPADLSEDFDTQLERYLTRLHQRYRLLELSGFESRVDFPLDLNELYIPLRATVDRYRGPRDGRKELDEDLLAHGFELGGRLEVPFDEALELAGQQGQRGIVVLGEPGAGKTTLLKHFVLACTDPAYGPGYLKLDAQTVPVLVQLRRLEDPRAGLCPAMLKGVTDADTTLGLDFVHRLLHRDRLLLLVDGLDEVADLEARAAVSRWLEDALRQLPSSRFVVTSRFAGYHGDVMLRSLFLRMDVRSLRPEEAKAFIRRWYQAVEARAELGRDAEMARAIAEEESNALCARLFRDEDPRVSSLKRLACNPLMLQIVCLVNRSRGQLPDKRVDLYRECTVVLLELWRRAKGIRLDLTASEAERLLQPVAWCMQLKGDKEAAVEEVRAQLEPALKKLNPPRPASEASAVLNVIKEQTGILVSVGQGRYQFLHESFREYLCARHVQAGLPDLERLRTLASHFGDEAWREVTLLAVGLCNPSLCEPLMDLVIQQGKVREAETLVLETLRDASEAKATPFLRALARGLGDDRETYSALRALKSLKGWSDEWVEVPGRRRERPLWQRIFDLADPVERPVRVTATALLEALLTRRPDVRNVGMLRELLAAQGVQTSALLLAGDVWVHPATGLELVYVPAGSFNMGSNKNSTEGPVHKVTFSRGFWIGKYPVTNAQYERFLKATGRSEPEYWTDSQWNAPEQPVVGVVWDDARAYCRWASSLLSGTDVAPDGASEIRLPSEAEWEYAARGPKGREFPWGDSSPTKELANFDRNVGRTTPVGNYPEGVSWVGALDMAGNVWEWCADHWHRNYSGAPEDGGPWMTNAAVPSGFSEKDPLKFRLIRGHCWANDAHWLRSAYRFGADSRYGGNKQGFRVVAASG